MGDIVQTKNIGALVDIQRCSDHATSTAGGSGDATTVTGLTIDRAGFSSGSLPRSALFGVLYEATIASGKTLSIGYAVQHSLDGSTWTDYQTATYAVVSTGASGGSTNKGTWNVACDLNSAYRYVRFNYNPDLNASGTDTSYSDAAGVFGGFDRLAAPVN
ncbi:MAG TPA: hypothetical protein VKR31_00800 [Rhizomicrobium sp.]|nr:hypothetical protein [Rhizomicrobium sp.]